MSTEVFVRIDGGAVHAPPAERVGEIVAEVGDLGPLHVGVTTLLEEVRS